MGSAEGQAGGNAAAQAVPWLVLRTKTKCEKFVRDQLLARGIEAYVPVTRRTARYVRKVKTYELPLISCYAFVRLPRDRRHEALALPYVQGMLRLDGRDCIVSDREMDWLQRVSGSRMEARVETASWQPGDKVMLTRGQLAGMEGHIVTRQGKHEMAIALDNLGLQLILQVPVEMLERTPGDR